MPNTSLTRIRYESAQWRALLRHAVSVTFLDRNAGTHRGERLQCVMTARTRGEIDDMTKSLRRQRSGQSK